jgi:membrane-associated phospholipid phosphatase
MAFSLNNPADKQSLGFWREGGWLDQLDKRLSTPVFTLELPLFLEFPLSVIGTWFGIPLSALVLLPIAAVSIVDGTPWWFAIAFGVVLSLWSYLAVCSVAAKGRRNGFVYFYMPLLTKQSMIWGFTAAPHIGLLLAMVISRSSAAYRAAVFTTLSWVISCGINEVLKGIVKRRRPVICDFDIERLDEEVREANESGGFSRSSSPVSPNGRQMTAFRSALLGAKRNFPELQRMLRSPESSHSSFPSGDATAVASAMVCLLSLVGFDGTVASILAQDQLLRQVYAPLAAATCLIASFGRMYFHAHHLLDVSVGLLGGATCTLLLLHFAGNGMEPASSWSYAHLLMAQVVIALLVLTRSPHLHTEDKSFVVSGPDQRK